ncbi:hypothetical protein DENIS_3748 [Desulfonema ishimotonii]|uniref:HEPN domain-containing protein n=1 Tax=Desulfonema ishimotonii TaxID=45657 RepID=A0A401G0N2_9BACT|nr:hypothetical protein [Desulfonema ishimotonii]GBC62771.1 hypothetical protein DENIS_3748 [Desulfonema ishimotonii]
MIHVSRKEMEKSFKKHRHIWNSSKNKGPSYSHKMVLFYAVECGLKSLFMTKFRVVKTDRTGVTGKSVSDFGHNLNPLLKQLRLERYRLPQVKDESGTQISPENVHQAWRYGRTLDSKKEEKFICRLKKILAELDAKI